MTKAKQHRTGRETLSETAAHDKSWRANKHHQSTAMPGRPKHYNGTVIKCRNATHASKMPITEKTSSKPEIHHGNTAKATRRKGPYCTNLAIHL